MVPVSLDVLEFSLLNPVQKSTNNLQHFFFPLKCTNTTTFFLPIFNTGDSSTPGAAFHNLASLIIINLKKDIDAAFVILPDAFFDHIAHLVRLPFAILNFDGLIFDAIWKNFIVAE